jgi:hypothetical protein
MNDLIAKAIEELDDIIRFAESNASAGSKDEQKTWGLHALKCAEVADMLRPLTKGQPT